MINLIPPAARKNIIKEYWVRVVTVWLFLAGTVSLIILFLLLPTYVLIGMQNNLLKQDVATASLKSHSYDVSATVLLNANRQAQLLVDTREVTPFSLYTNKLEKLAGTKVTIQEMRFSRLESLAGTIQISGVSNTRQNLADFRDAIEADQNFSTVDLPISSLVKDRDLLFSMEIVLATTTAINMIN